MNSRRLRWIFLSISIGVSYKPCIEDVLRQTIVARKVAAVWFGVHESIAECSNWTPSSVRGSINLMNWTYVQFSVRSESVKTELNRTAASLGLAARSSDFIGLSGIMVNLTLSFVVSLASMTCLSRALFVPTLLSPVAATAPTECVQSSFRRDWDGINFRWR